MERGKQKKNIENFGIRIKNYGLSTNAPHSFINSMEFPPLHPLFFLYYTQCALNALRVYYHQSWGLKAPINPFLLGTYGTRRFVLRRRFHSIHSHFDCIRDVQLDFRQISINKTTKSHMAQTPSVIPVAQRTCHIHIGNNLVHTSRGCEKKVLNNDRRKKRQILTPTSNDYC